MVWLILKWVYGISIIVGVISVIYLLIDPPPDITWHD